MSVIDDFFTAYNTSRCKTAMLLITFLFMVAFAAEEIMNVQNPEMHTMLIVITGYWVGRTSKPTPKTTNPTMAAGTKIITEPAPAPKPATLENIKAAVGSSNTEKTEVINNA